MPLSLVKVVFSEGLEIIGDKVFYECENLCDVEFPQSLKSIGNSAFYKCSGLKKVYIPDGVSFSGWRAFWYCTQLTDVKTRNLQQFCTTPWGDPIDKKLVEYLKSVLSDREQRHLCPYCGSRIKKRLSIDNLNTICFYCSGCDYSYSSEISNVLNYRQDYDRDVHNLAQNPLTDNVCYISSGFNGNYTKKEIAFAQLVIDFLARFGLRW